MDLLLHSIQMDWPVLLPILVCSILVLAAAINRVSFYNKNKRDVVQFIPKLQKELAKNNAEEEARQIQMKKDAEELSKRLEHINVEFKAKVGSDGRMFGSISPKEIEEGMMKQWGIKIDKRKFLDKYPANALGYTRLKIELYKGSQGVVTGVVNVHIAEEK